MSDGLTAGSPTARSEDGASLPAPIVAQEPLADRVRRLEGLVVYLCQVVGVEGPEGMVDPEAQHRRFIGVLRKKGR